MPTTNPDPGKRRGRGRPPGSPNKPKPPAPEAPRLGYRIDEFAKAVGISRSTVVRLINTGKIKTVKVGQMRIVPLAEAQRMMTPRCADPNGKSATH